MRSPRSTTVCLFGRSPALRAETLALAAAIIAGSAAPCLAQAWLPAQGEGAVTLSHQLVHSPAHLNRDGTPNPANGKEWIHAVHGDVEYGLSDRLSVSGGLLWLATKWVGSESNRHGPLDDGTFHYSLQDLETRLHYQVATGRLAIAAHGAVSLPTRGYETRGHAAFGRGLSDVSVGVSAASVLARPGGLRALQGVYAAASVSYSFVERSSDEPQFDLDRINGDFAVGRRLGRRVSVRGFGAWQVMRDGLTFPLTAHEREEFFSHHDQLARSSYLQLGGGVGIGLQPDLLLSLAAFSTASGRNLHSVRSLTTALTWSFGAMTFKVRD